MLHSNASNNIWRDSSVITVTRPWPRYVSKVFRLRIDYTNRRKADWIGHTLHRNCLLKHVLQGKTEGIGKRGRTRKQLLDDLKEMSREWKLKEEALDRPLCRTGFGRGYGLSVRQTT